MAGSLEVEASSCHYFSSNCWKAAPDPTSSGRMGAHSWSASGGAQRPMVDRPARRTNGADARLAKGKSSMQPVDHAKQPQFRLALENKHPLNGCDKCQQTNERLTGKTADNHDECGAVRSPMCQASTARQIRDGDWTAYWVNRALRK